MKKIYLFLNLALALCLTACYDLDKLPEGQLSTTDLFSTLGGIRTYLDQFYESGVRGQGFEAGGNSGIAGYDSHSDNMSSNSASARLDGKTALSNASKLKNYEYIRNVNTLLNEIGSCKDKDASPAKTALYNQYVGEAYYFRAWYYYTMMVNYGQLTWVNKPFAADEEMQYPRANRTVIADSILADLDKAIAHLSAKDNSASMRVHKDVARALKSEVALFEGTWEKYHKAKGDKFYDPTVTDAKINDYLKQAAAAAKEVMDRNVWAIYNSGKPLEDYRVIFQTTDLSTNKEILWFKKYDGDQIGNSVDRYLNKGGGSCGVTASLVDDYLTKDGKPFLGEDKSNAQKVFGDELSPELRDPRLSQTVCLPGQQLRPAKDPYVYVVPPFIAKESFHQNTTGFSLLKHVQIDYTGNLNNENKGATPAIQFRYADVLLNYAEALAELDGAGNAPKIIEALRPLRERVGMPDVDFAKEHNTDAEYPFKDLDPYIQAVRRERRVEKACEGRRLEDILRWAAAEELIVGKWAKGALFIGSNLENHEQYKNDKGEYLLKYDQATDNNLWLDGKPGDAQRYILPCNPADHPHGFEFKVDRDYLLPIQQRMLSLTGNKWEQNPGW